MTQTHNYKYMWMWPCAKYFPNILDTSKEGECSSHSDGCHSDGYGQGPEQEFKMRLRELGANVVYKGMDLTQTKYSKCL